MARTGLADFAAFRRMTPQLADALYSRALEMEREEAEADGEVQAAAVKAIQQTIVAAAMAIAKTVAARPSM